MMENNLGKVLYCPPFGDDVEDPGSDEIRDIVFNKSADYWKKGSGDSGIEIQGMDERLVFFNYKDFGIFIMLSPGYEVPVLRIEKGELETLSHNIGGNEFRFPSCCLLAKEDAWKIIDHFIKTGEKLIDFDWMELYEIEFDHGF